MPFHARPEYNRVPSALTVQCVRSSGYSVESLCDFSTVPSFDISINTGRSVARFPDNKKRPSSSFDAASAIRPFSEGQEIFLTPLIVPEAVNANNIYCTLAVLNNQDRDIIKLDD